MYHRVLKCVSSALRRIVKHVTVQGWIMGLPTERSETLGPTFVVRGLAEFLRCVELDFRCSVFELDLWCAVCELGLWCCITPNFKMMLLATKANPR